MEADEIVLVAFMVSHEDVLAVNGTVLTPPTFRLFDCLALRMLVTREWYVVFPKKRENFFLPF
jgi:hypothetical protein